MWIPEGAKKHKRNHRKSDFTSMDDEFIDSAATHLKLIKRISNSKVDNKTVQLKLKELYIY